MLYNVSLISEWWCYLTDVLSQEHESNAMFPVNNNAKVDETQSDMEPGYVLETLDLAR